jgi:antitoxin ParD1/3/4
MTMTISLTPQLERMVRQKLSSGLYHSAGEVVCEALRLMDAQERLREAGLGQLRQDIREGLESGEPTPWDAEEIKRAARRHRAAQLAGETEA